MRDVTSPRRLIPAPPLCTAARATPVVFGVAAGIVLVLGVTSARAQSDNVVEVGQFANGSSYTDVEGYDAPDGTALAIIGTTASTVFVDVTDPANPVEVANIRGPISGWREMEVYRDYCYVVNEASGGLQVIDLTDPQRPELSGNFESSFQSAHTVSVDSETGVLYASGSNVGTAIFNLEPDPTSPRFVTSFGEYYIHDLYAEGGRVYAAAIYGAFLGILDVSNLPLVDELSRTVYAGAATHNAWLTEDGRYCLTTDERGGGYINVFDVSDPENPEHVGAWVHPENPASSVHNVTVRDGYAYIAWYSEGLQILDLEEPSQPVRVGYFDTTPASGLFDGAWGVHPFTRSGLVYVSDRQTGLHILEFQGRVAPVAVSVHDPEGLALAGAEVRLPDLGRTFVTGDDGMVHLRLPEGTHVLRIEAFGYEPFETRLTIHLGDDVALDATLLPLPSGSVRGTVRTLDGDLVDSGTILVEETPLLASVGPGGAFQLPRVPAGAYRIRAARFGERGLIETVAVTAGAETEVELELMPARFADDFESDRGWLAGIASDAATHGLWVRADPFGTADGSIQPEDDASPEGTRAFVTGNQEGAGIGDDDVDGGATTLVSPRIDLSGAVSPVLSYARWFSNDQGPAVDDSLLVEVSSDGGLTWAVAEELGVSTPRWERVEIQLANLIAVSDQVVVRFVASDFPGSSVVEAAVDDVEIVELLGVLAGTVVESGSGLPIADAEVTIDAARLANGISQRTDEQGAFEFFLAAGDVELTVRDYRYGPATETLRVDPFAIAEAAFTLTKKPVSALEGIVESGGAPLAGAQVALLGTPLAAESAGDGSFRFAEVPIGAYRVTAARDGFATVESEVTIAETGNAPLALSLVAQFASELLFTGPNPVRDQAVISLRLATPGRVVIDLFDPAGRKAASIWDGELAAGEHALPWSPRSVSGRDVPQGIYFQRVELAGRTYTRRVVVLR